MTSFQDYMHFMVERPHSWDYVELDDATIQQMQSGGNHEHDNQLLQSLTHASNCCRECQTFITQEAARMSRASIKTGTEDSEDLEDGTEEEREKENPGHIPD